ncbi:pyridoxal-phosphate-dependent aminotransferase family protein [Streptomyces sp. x-19]|uniref:pyridoxal-phosphate-dependent aminotransferase family protein n=1 Tax=Streptomyces sp. x-19 TaxID=2789280 RepID=UPI0039818FD2
MNSPQQQAGSFHTTGRHFLQIPGPTNVPDPVLRALAAPTIDHRGPAFAELARRVLTRLGPVFGTTGPIALYPSSGTGAWEAALVNTLSPGDRVLFFETGHFAVLWQELAERLGLDVELVPGDWRHGADPAALAARLAHDPQHRVKAVCVVHNETSTGVTSPVCLLRSALDEASHPALFLVDTVSSLGSTDYRHDEWGVDVTVAGSQKGLMLPPGLGLNAIGPRALEAHRTARLPRAYWDWDPLLDTVEHGRFPYTPATNLLYGLDVALDLLAAEGLPQVFARHARHAAATRAAVRGWGLTVLCADPRAHSSTLTAVLMPDGQDADALRATVLDRYDMSLGNGLGRLAGRVFRIGHLGQLSDLQLAGALAGVQMGLSAHGFPADPAGLTAALDALSTA